MIRMPEQVREIARMIYLDVFPNTGGVRAQIFE